MNRQRGTALITVLWVVLIISIIALTLAASVRAQIDSEMDTFDSERAFFLAKGAAETMFALFANRPRLPDDSPMVQDSNGDYVFAFDTGEARVHFESSAGLIDLNYASDIVLAALFDSLGVSVEQRNHLVDSILDWRDEDDIPHLYGAEIHDYEQVKGQRLPRNAPFETVDELLQVKNVTPEIFKGSVVVDPVTGRYRRIPGVRELLTVDSHSSKIDVNLASIDVLLAIPQMTFDLAQKISSEHAKSPFSNPADLVKRVPEMQGNAALQYLAVSVASPTVLISRGTIRSSGATRTVRVVFKREEKTQIFSVQPLLYRRFTSIKFDHWQF